MKSFERKLKKFFDSEKVDDYDVITGKIDFTCEFDSKKDLKNAMKDLKKLNKEIDNSIKDLNVLEDPYTLNFKVDVEDLVDALTDYESDAGNEALEIGMIISAICQMNNVKTFLQTSTALVVRK